MDPHNAETSVQEILDLKDLNIILENLHKSHFSPVQWQRLGLVLGLQYNTIQVIEADHRNDVMRCLTECLAKWLRRVDRVNENGGATKAALINGLDKIEERASAEYIRHQALSTSRPMESQSNDTTTTPTIPIVTTDGPQAVETTDQSGAILSYQSVNQSAPFPTRNQSNISYDEEQVIGTGANGTMVFKGIFGRDGTSRDVAVKRIRYGGNKLFLEEVTKLLKLDTHENIIKYYDFETVGIYVHIALELCLTSLGEYVQDNGQDKLQGLVIDEKIIIQDAMQGLHHLHNLRIVHRDMKPDNILLTAKSSTQVKAVLCDFGISTQIEKGRVSATTGNARGTFGWKAPELCHGNSAKRSTCTTAVDIFAMGCVIYYVLSSGGHPFGRSEVRAHGNIVSEGEDEESEEYHRTYPLTELSKKILERKAAEHLVKLMIAKKRDKRPIAEEVLKHCYFWSKSKQLEFIQDVSDWLKESKDPAVATVKMEIDRNAQEVIIDDWKNHIDPKLSQELAPYKGTSLCDLLRAIRNKRHHYRKLTNDLQKILGSLPDGYMTYFLTQFPSIVIYVYKRWM